MRESYRPLSRKAPGPGGQYMKEQASMLLIVGEVIMRLLCRREMETQPHNLVQGPVPDQLRSSSELRLKLRGQVHGKRGSLETKLTWLS